GRAESLPTQDRILHPSDRSCHLRLGRLFPGGHRAGGHTIFDFLDGAARHIQAGFAKGIQVWFDSVFLHKQIGYPAEKAVRYRMMPWVYPLLAVKWRHRQRFILSIARERGKVKAEARTKKSR